MHSTELLIVELETRNSSMTNMANTTDERAERAERAERSDGKMVKMEVDYSSTVDQRIPECERTAKVS